MSNAADQSPVPDLDVGAVSNRTTRQFAPPAEDEAPEKSGQYVIDSWRVSQPPLGATNFEIDLAALGKPTLRVAEPDFMEVPGLEEPSPKSLEPAPRDAVLPPPPSLRTQSIVEPRILMRTAGDARTSIEAFAGYGNPPDGLLATPSYAVRVLSRKWTLRRELEAARERGSRDVPVYEAAIVSADTDSVQAGILVAVCALVGVALAVIAIAALV